MRWGLLNAAMLMGLLGVLIPLVIHRFHRRRDEVIDWGAMQFLELGRAERRRVRLTEWLLLLTRMGLLALVALALARPFWKPTPSAADGPGESGGNGFLGAPARAVVLVLDGSASMDRKRSGTTARALALRWARQFVARLRPGDSVAVLVARDRVRPLVVPLSTDRARVEAALAGVAVPCGSSDLAAALAEAFHVLESAREPAGDVVVLTDGQRAAWRPDEAARRWALVRDLHRRLPVPPRIWSVAFGAEAPDDTPNGSVAPLALSRPLTAPGLPIAVTTAVFNAGPGPLTRTAELLIDGRPAPGSAHVVGPVPAGGRVPLSFRATVLTPGEHLLTVRLVGGDDALPADDEAALPLTVAVELPVLLVHDRDSLEPLNGATDFLQAALAPAGDDAPQVRATSLASDRLDDRALRGRRLAVLADVERLSPEQAAALGRFVAAGGGVLVAPGDRTDPDAWGAPAWIPARLGALRGDPGARVVVAHPAPETFAGSPLDSFARGEAPALAGAGFFAYRVLVPAAGASVRARLDTGDPWAVERPHGSGRVLVLATPLDAAGGTLPVNPDFVPLVHEWVFHLAGGTFGPGLVRPGEPLTFDLDPPPAPELISLPLRTPGGEIVPAAVVRAAGGARARYRGATEPGVYRLTLPEPPGGFAFASVAGDPREADPAPLSQAEAEALAEGWPLSFEQDPNHLAARWLAAGRGHGGRHELWRGLILAALGVLCLELWLTRRLALSQVLAPP